MASPIAGDEDLRNADRTDQRKDDPIGKSRLLARNLSQKDFYSSFREKQDDQVIMARRRIAIFVKHLVVGGLEKIMVRLANEFAAKGYPVDLVVAKGGGSLEHDVSPDVRVVALNSSRLWYAAFSLRRYIKRERPDVVLSAGWQVNLIAIWTKLLLNGSPRLVVSVRTNTTQQSRRTRLWYARASPLAVKIFYPYADAITTVSQGVFEDLKQISRRAARKAQVIYNPVVDETIGTKSQLPIEHPWFNEAETENAPVIVAVGRLDPQKNFPLLLRAFRKLRENTEARLIIVGDGKERHHLEALSQELNLSSDIDLVGLKRNPYPYMASASLFVLSSNFEGFGLVLVEALACGCPVVSTNCPSGPGEILEDGKWGLLVPVGDEAALADAMRRSLAASHDADRLKRRAQDFTVEKAVAQYLNVLLPEERTSLA